MHFSNHQEIGLISRMSRENVEEAEFLLENTHMQIIGMKILAIDIFIPLKRVVHCAILIIQKRLQ